jgi:hypothetical protein
VKTRLVFVAAGTFLPSRCLATAATSGSTIPVFGGDMDAQTASRAHKPPFFSVILYDQVKEDEMGMACSTNGGEEECI